MARNRPVILTVDDDPQVLREIERDLKRQYAANYRVLRAEGAAQAMDLLKQLTVRGGEQVALILSDQRMPEMNGVEFLENARTFFPEARRVLLTAYADTDAAIQAINGAKVNYYLTKPWQPAEERLYPILDGFLADWEASQPSPDFDGIRVVGHRWSREAHAIKDFLARNLVPYKWVDIEEAKNDPETGRVLEAIGADAALPCLPLVLFPDGSRLIQPTPAQIGEKIGLKIKASLPFYDLVIIGAGPAGLAAAVYGASEGLKTLLIEREAPGGQAGTSSKIENYLGFPTGISGGLLTQYARDQAIRFGVEILTPQEVEGLRIEEPYRIVTLKEGKQEISCYAMLIATGVSYKMLDIPGLAELTGRGVYYGAAKTEALGCKDDDVYIVGGANSAGQAAVYFAGYARCVTLLVRGDSLEKGMSQYLIDALKTHPNVRVWLNSGVTGVSGEEHLESVTIRKDGEISVQPARAMFIFIGAVPRTECLKDIILRDSRGFILAGPDLPREGKRPKGWHLERDPFLLETSVPGIFVAGDVRAGSVKRVASGVGEGSIAVQFIHQYLATVRGQS